MDQVWNVLLIEDDDDDYIITREMLSSAKGAHYNLVWVNNFHDGLRVMSTPEARFDAVLVDYDLGPKTGIELIHAGRNMGYPAPFVLLTGRGSYEIDVEAMNAGASVYLTKNEVNPLLLERSIRYAIERKQTEEALRATNEALLASEERFRTVLENSLDVAYRRNLQTGHYDYISPVVEEMLGYSVDEMVSMQIPDFFEHFHPDDRRMVEEEMPQAARAGKGRLEYRFRRKDGVYLWLADHVTVENAPDGTPHFWTGIVRDITARKRYEQALRDNEARAWARAYELQTFMDAAPAYVWIARDPQCREMIGNQATYQLLNMPEGGNISKTAPAEEMPRKFRAFRDGMELSPSELPMQIAAATGEHVRNAKFEMVFEDGQRVHVSGNAAPLLDHNGNPAGAVGVFLDVTPQKIIEHQGSRNG